METPTHLTVALAPGINPRKWSRVWEERRAETPLEFATLHAAEARQLVLDDGAQVAFVRHPFEREGLNAIDLFAEDVVAVVAVESDLDIDEPLRLEELDDWQLVLAAWTPDWAEAAERLGLDSGASAMTTDPADAMELVAGGAGVAIVPQSVARQHSRKDVTYRVISDLPRVPVSIVWAAEDDRLDTEEFVGIVRGRTAGSSRGRTGAKSAALQREEQQALAEAERRVKEQQKKKATAKRIGTSSGTSRGAQLAAKRAKAGGSSGKRKRR